MRAKLLQTDQAAYMLLIPAATRLEIALYERRSHMAEDCYPPIFLEKGQRVRIHAWYGNNTDALTHQAHVLSVRCTSEGIICSDNIEMHISESGQTPFLLSIKTDVEPFEQPHLG